MKQNVGKLMKTKLAKLDEKVKTKQSDHTDVNHTMHINTMILNVSTTFACLSVCVGAIASKGEKILMPYN